MPKMSVCIKMPILPCCLCAFSGIIFLLHTCHELNSFSVLMTCIVLKIGCKFPENYIREPHWPRFLKKAGVCLWLVERSSCLLFELFASLVAWQWKEKKRNMLWPPIELAILGLIVRCTAHYTTKSNRSWSKSIVSYRVIFKFKFETAHLGFTVLPKETLCVLFYIAKVPFSDGYSTI